MSRYRTLSEATKSASEAVKASRATIDRGRRSRLTPTKECPRTIMNTARTTACRTKSTPAAPIDARGRISRGKYTFVTRFALSTTDLAPSESAVEKRFHARIPESR